MSLPRHPSVSRRKAVAAGLAGLALAVPYPRGADARIARLRGMAGGGLARLDSGDEPRLANLSLAASAMQLPGGSTLFVGRLQWIEAGTGLRLESSEVTQCIPVAGRTDGAEVRGRLSVNGEGDYPFVIEAYDTGLPGSGLDTIKLEVNGPNAREGTERGSPDPDFAYEMTATLVGGDFQWVVADIDVPAAE